MAIALLMPNQYSNAANLDRIEATTHHLVLTDGTKFNSCSATAISPNAILTANHCFFDGKVSALYMDGRQQVEVVKIISDKFDHTLVILNKKFKQYACFSRSQPKRGDQVVVFGNPATNRNLFRLGYVSGFSDNDYTIYDINVWFGDSGSALFNEKDHIIGVLSVISNESEIIQSKIGSFKLAGSRPFDFTEKELNEAGVGRGCHGIAIKEKD